MCTQVYACVHARAHTHVHTLFLSPMDEAWDAGWSLLVPGEGCPLRPVLPTVGALGQRLASRSLSPEGPSGQPGSASSAQPARLPQARVGARPGPRAGGPVVRPVMHRRHRAQTRFPERGHSLTHTRVLFSKQDDCTCTFPEKQELPPPRPGSCWSRPAGTLPRFLAVFLAVSN